MLHEITLGLAFIVIFIIVHIIFKNIRDILLWSCKFITATYLWSLIWIATQLHRLPEWQETFTKSAWTLINMTKIEL